MEGLVTSFFMPSLLVLESPNDIQATYCACILTLNTALVGKNWGAEPCFLGCVLFLVPHPQFNVFTFNYTDEDIGIHQYCDKKEPGKLEITPTETKQNFKMFNVWYQLLAPKNAASNFILVYTSLFLWGKETQKVSLSKLM